MATFNVKDSKKKLKEMKQNRIEEPSSNSNLSYLQQRRLDDLQKSAQRGNLSATLDEANSAASASFGGWQNASVMAANKSKVQAGRDALNKYYTDYTAISGVDNNNAKQIKSALDQYDQILGKWDEATKVYGQYKTADAFDMAATKSKYASYSFDDLMDAVYADDASENLKKYAVNNTNYSSVEDYDKAIQWLESSEYTRNYAGNVRKAKEDFLNADPILRYKDLQDAEDFTNASKYVAPSGTNRKNTMHNVINGNRAINPTTDRDVSNWMLLQNNATEEELAMENYLFNSNSSDYDSYVNGLFNKYQKNQYEEDTEALKGWLENSGVLGNALYSAGSVLMDIITAPAVGYETVRSLATGKDATYTGLTAGHNMLQEGNQQVASNIAKATDGFEIAGVNVPAFLYQTAMSTAASKVGETLFGPAYTVLMGTQAYASTYKSAKERGLSDENATATALSAGVAEALFEYISFDKWSKLKVKSPATKLEAVTNVLKQMFVEGSEEFNTDVANAIADQFINGKDSEISQNYQHYLDMGYSKDEAWSKTAGDFAVQLGESFIGGGLSGGFSSVFHSVGNYKYNAETGNIIDEAGNTVKLSELAAGLDQNSDAFNYVESLKKKYDGDINKAGKAEIGHLYNLAIKQSAVEARTAMSEDMKNGVVAYLEMNGITGETQSDMVDALTKKMDGARLSSYQKQLLNNHVAQSLIKNLDNQSFKINDTNTKEKYSVIKDISDTKRLDVRKVESVEKNDAGEYVAKVGNKEMKLSKEMLDTNEGIVMQNATNYSGDAQKNYIENYDGKTRANLYDTAWSLAYTYGKMEGANRGDASQKAAMQEAMTSPIVSTVFTADQLMSVFTQGVKDANKEASVERAKIEEIKKSFAGELKSGTIRTEGIDEKNLTVSQQCILDVLKGFANLGMNIRVINDNANDSENGDYNWDTDEVTINLSARYSVNDQFNDPRFVVSTMAHEFTHWMQAHSSDMYSQLKGLIYDAIGSNKMKTLIQKEMDRYEASHDKKMSYEAALDEVIARACEDMMNDTSKVSELLAGADEGFLAKLKNAIRSFFRYISAFLNELMKNYGSNSEAAKIIRSVEGRVEQIRETWMKGIADALENVATGVKVNEVQEISENDEDAQYSAKVDSEGNNLTEAQQEFFKDSQVRNDDGQLLVMYHGTPAYGFTVFDPKKAKRMGQYGNGFYFSSSGHASTYGKTYEVYLNIKNPLKPGIKTITKEQLRKYVEAIAENEDYGIENYGQSATVNSIVNDLYGKEDFQVLADLNATCVGNFTEALKYFNEVNGTDYDGIIAPTETVAFYSNQIKLTTNHNPTENEDIRYSSKVDSEGNSLTEGQREYFAESKIRDDDGNLLVVYHGSTEDFTVFDRSKGRTNMDINGMFFSPWDIDAGGYGDNVRAFYLNIKNPAPEALGYKALNKFKGQNGAGVKAREYLESLGYDGVNNGGEEYIAFYPEQIKEITNQNPTSNPDIRYSNKAEWHTGMTDAEVTMLEKRANSEKNATDNYLSDTDKWLLYNNGKNTYFALYSLNNVDEKNGIYPTILYASKGNRALNDAMIINHLLSIAKGAENGKDFVKKTRASGRVSSGYWYAIFRDDVSDYAVVARGSGSRDDEIRIENTRYRLRPAYRSCLENIAALSASRRRGRGLNNNIQQSTKTNEDVLQRENKNLKAENAKLREDVTRLAHRLSLEAKVTGGKVLDRSQVEMAAKSLKKMYDSTIDTQTLTMDLYDFYSYIVKNNPSESDMMNRAVEVARSIMEKSKPVKVTDTYATGIIRDIRKARIKLSEEQIKEAKSAFGENYRNYLMGKITTAKDGISLDSQWVEWANRYPELFDASISEPDQIVELLDIYNKLKDMEETLEQNYDEDYLRTVGLEIYNKAWNIGRVTTIADKYDAEIKRLKAEHKKAMEELRASMAQQVDNTIAENSSEAKYLDLLARWNKREAEIKKKAKDFVKDKQDAIARNAEIEKISKAAFDLAEWTVTNKKNHYVPQALKKPIVELVNAINFSTENISGKNTGTPVLNAARGHKSLVAAMEHLHEMAQNADALKKDGDFLGLDLPEQYHLVLDALYKNMVSIRKEIGNEKFVLANMSLDDLKQLKNALYIFKQSLYNANKMISTANAQSMTALSQDTMQFLKKLGKKKHENVLTKFLESEQITPYYFFNNLGEGGRAVFDALMDGQDKLAFKMKEIEDFFHDTIDAKTLKKWRNEVHTFTVTETVMTDEGKTETVEREVQMTTTQLMSLYEHSKREQSMSHIIGIGSKQGDGIQVANFTVKEGKKPAKTIKQNYPIKMTESILKSMLNELTDEQKEAADALQKYMQDIGGSWGNQITMKRFGILGMTEDHYFPIKVSNDVLATDTKDSQSSIYRLLNMGFTKQLLPNAKNQVIIEDIADVYVQHMTDMAKYSSIALPVLDTIRWWNHKEENANGTKDVLKTEIRNALGSYANTYISNFLRDLNMSQDAGRGESISNTLLRRYKTAAVGFSAQVALLQPLSYIRAAYAIEPKYLAKAFTKKPAVSEVQKKSGIALWKSMGSFDTNIGRTMANRITGDDTFMDKVTESSLKAAEMMDNLTWGVLWNACKAKVKAETDLKEGTKEFDDAVGHQFREVVYKTQVVDSTMTRSDIMRSKSGLAKLTTAFLSEPTISYNMLMDAYREFNNEVRRGKSKAEAFKKSGKKIRLATLCYTISAVAESALRGAIAKVRYPDDDEKFSELFLDQFMSELNVLRKIPYAKDIMEVFDGYSPTRMDEQVFQTAKYGWDALQRIPDEGLTYRNVYRVLQFASQASGIAGSDLLRDTVTAWNAVVGNIYPSLRIETK